MAGQAVPNAAKPAGLVQQLSQIQIGGAKKASKVKKRDLIYMLRNISTLVDNGLSLPKALETVSQEKTLRKYAHMLVNIRQRVEQGETFSNAAAKFRDAFSDLMIQQIKVGERSGTLSATLARLTAQLEQGDNLKSQIIKRLTYPAMLMFFGSGAVSFMLLFVVPTFEKTYSESGAKLPAVTQLLIDTGRFGKSYGWLIAIGIVATVVGTILVRRNPTGRYAFDRSILRIPMLGDWFRNIAVLQFMEVLGNLMDSGFTVVESLEACSRAINNMAIRRSIEELRLSVLRGEKFSSELEKHGNMFPPIAIQLVIIGEKTGTLAKVTTQVREHLRREVERTTNLMLGTIEPVMTITLAGAIGTILLAIYLPMFDMINTMG
ncbi:MAG: type II secretion system F family protein [Pirellulaceae bacterium]|nr:type II secretion system F family protein [Planctomycetales bacterium]